MIIMEISSKMELKYPMRQSFKFDSPGLHGAILDDDAGFPNQQTQLVGPTLPEFKA